MNGSRSVSRSTGMHLMGMIPCNRLLRDENVVGHHSNRRGIGIRSEVSDDAGMWYSSGQRAKARRDVWIASHTPSIQVRGASSVKGRHLANKYIQPALFLILLRSSLCGLKPPPACIQTHCSCVLSAQTSSLLILRVLVLDLLLLMPDPSLRGSERLLQGDPRGYERCPASAVRLGSRLTVDAI